MTPAHAIPFPWKAAILCGLVGGAIGAFLTLIGM